MAAGLAAKKSYDPSGQLAVEAPETADIGDPKGNILRIWSLEGYDSGGRGASLISYHPFPLGHPLLYCLMAAPVVLRIIDRVVPHAEAGCVTDARLGPASRTNPASAAKRPGPVQPRVRRIGIALFAAIDRE